MNITVGKFGGGTLSSTQDIKRLPDVIRQTQVNIVVVSAFKGDTRLLTRICDEENGDIFFREILPKHRQWAQELEVFYLIEDYYKRQEIEFSHCFERFCFANLGSSEREECRAKILAMGEDMSSALVYKYLEVYLLRSYSSQNRIETFFVDSRLLMKTCPGVYIDAPFDHIATREAVGNFFDEKILREKRLWVTQGFVCSPAGSEYEGIENTSVSKLDGSDVTAAQLASVLSAKLLFFKRFEGGTENRISGMIGIRRLFRYMEQKDSKIVSPSIIEVPNFPISFVVQDYDNLDVVLDVVADPLMVEKIISERLVVK